MPEHNKNPFDINAISHKVSASEAFYRAGNEDGTRQLSVRDRRRKAIGMAASTLTGESSGGYLTLEGHAMNITAKLTHFSDSINEIHRLREAGARHSEKVPALRHIAEFNHAVKDMIDSNQSLGFAEVLTFILRMNQEINGRSAGGQQFETEARGVLVGMRHEIGFEQIVGKIPSAEYQEATINDDLNGADIFISIDGSPLLPFDIKASYETAQRAKQEAASYGYDSSHIVWSHIDEEDFNGTFRISNKTAELKAAAVYRDLRAAIHPHTSMAYSAAV